MLMVGTVGSTVGIQMLVIVFSVIVSEFALTDVNVSCCVHVMILFAPMFVLCGLVVVDCSSNDVLKSIVLSSS